jgi:DNA polymerase-3 subunit alpha
MGFPGYFLIVADFIAWAKNNGVPVGPGRGSGCRLAGRLVHRHHRARSAALRPAVRAFPEPRARLDARLRYRLLRRGRDRVIDYVADHYGRKSVSQIITYGTLAAKAAVRDCGRVLGYQYGLVDSIAKLIPPDLNMTLRRPWSRNPS